MKRGQSATAASTLIALIGLIIVLYILFLPPEDRAKLLDDEGTTPRSSGGQLSGTLPSPQTPLAIPPSETLLFSTIPGVLEYATENQVDHPIPSFYLHKTTNAKVLEEIPSFTVRSSWKSSQQKNITFSIPDLENTDTVLLSFSAPVRDGSIRITLNGEEIYDAPVITDEPSPLPLKKSLLQEENMLTFSIESVGNKFWSTNEASFVNMKITGNVADVSAQMANNLFFVTPTEGERVESAALRIEAECNTREVGKLTIRINGHTIASAVPDCGSVTYYEFSPEYLAVGKNSLTIETEKGSYFIDQILIKTKLRDAFSPVYFFEIGDEWFEGIDITSERHTCGETDGFCPAYCDEDVDIDCCYKEYSQAFWCDAPTSNSDDRCVEAVQNNTCSRCMTGYEDERGYPPDSCKTQCGDDTDKFCPTGCDKNYDRDCCYNSVPSGENVYWCDVLPTTGLMFACVDSVSIGECRVCPIGYLGKSTRPYCQFAENTISTNHLLRGYFVMLTMKFADGYSPKQADIFINGHLTRLETRDDYYFRDITEFIEPGSNSVKLVPYSQLEVSSLTVEVTN